MVNVCPFLYFAIIIIGCHSEEPSNNLEREQLIDEIEEDNDFLPRTTLDPERNINDIIQRGFDVSELIHHDVIDADMGIMRYTLNDTDILGFNYCKVLRTMANRDISSMVVNVRCPKIIVNGLYRATGVLITMPIEGNGDYNFDCEDYYVSITTGFKKFEGQDGKMHLKFKTYSLMAEVHGKVTYRLNNLFNGNQEQSNTLHKFINENWRDVADFGQYPIWYPSMKIILKNANKFLKPIPVDELIFNQT